MILRSDAEEQARRCRQGSSTSKVSEFFADLPRISRAAVEEQAEPGRIQRQERRTEAESRRGRQLCRLVRAAIRTSRLDEQFRLPTDIWDKLPQYKDWGLPSSKLKGEMKVHPMAFGFPDEQSSFTFRLHTFDGTVPDKAASTTCSSARSIRKTS
jgi:hypothetical protein